MQSDHLIVTVSAIRQLASQVHLFELQPVDGHSLPAYEPGAHIDISLAAGLARQYSLVAPYQAGQPYLIAVKRAVQSRGGSHFMHDTLRVGQQVHIQAPRNNFALHADAGHSVLIAGGIGITPVWCMAQALERSGRSWEMHYAVRTRGDAAFLPELQALGGRARLHVDDESGGPLDIQAIESAAPQDSHFYCCGPAPMLDAFEQACAARSAHQVHLERFGPVELAAGKEQALLVRLARSGKELQVDPQTSILDALLNAGIDVPNSCQAGVCGACETRVLSGIPDHRDQILTERERSANQVMMVCCSRSLSDSLTLDL
ncbi:PDR/VanB family oxidoreductase [Undibacterium sp. TJN25]|uniref:PDR/VanB family oxidoreductase n=1 Tax=Undibacterium sp. TJN25 TaxID=3413056 RepID=UPI003BF25210